MCGIYKITNLENGKIYIGQSVKIEERWRAHHNRPFNSNYDEYNTPLYRAIRKYGLDSFSFEVLEECDKQKLNEKEKYWIQFYHSSDEEYGYNLTEGGEGSIRYIKLNKEQVAEVCDLLINSALTQKDIADKYSVSQATISALNMGITHPNIDYVYPLRPLKEAYARYTDMSLHTCPVCGNIKTDKAEVCIDCYNQQRSNHIPNREILKKLIREKSFVQIGKDFGVTDNAVRKWCDKYDLPRRRKDIKQYSDEEWATI